MSALPEPIKEAALLEALASCAAGGRLSDAQVHAMRARRRRALAGSAAAALVAMVGALWLRGPAGAPPVSIAHLETRRGEQRSFRLRDGSTVRLSGATALDIRLEADRRSATLRSGEAYFDIAHDPARPFAVAAANSDTRVLGTAFDVELAGAAVKLAVYRGRVRFGPAASTRAGDTVTVPAGWRSQFRGGAAGAPTRFDRARQDWRDGWLDTDAMRLGEVVETLNRGGGPLIAPPPARLAALPLSGRFKLDAPRPLLEAIGDAYGFRVLGDAKQLRLQENEVSQE